MEALDKIRSGISHYCAFCFKEYEEEKVPKLCPCGHGDIRSMEELVPPKVLKEYKEQQKLLEKKFNAEKHEAKSLPEDWGLNTGVPCTKVSFGERALNNPSAKSLLPPGAGYMAAVPPTERMEVETGRISSDNFRMHSTLHEAYTKKFWSKFSPSSMTCGKCGFAMFERRPCDIDATEYYCAHCNRIKTVTDESISNPRLVMKKMKVMKVIIYEGDESWVKETLKRSLVNEDREIFCGGGGRIRLGNIHVLDCRIEPLTSEPAEILIDNGEEDETNKCDGS